MPTSSRWSDRLALGFALLRGTMLMVLALVLLFIPERAMPGSTTEPARRLALIVVSRTMLLGFMLAGLAVKRSRGALAWVLFVDGALQLADTGASVSMGSAAAVLPAILGVLDALAGRVLLRTAREAKAPEPEPN